MMRKIATLLGIGALTFAALSPSPAGAFGFHLGPLHFGLPYFGPHHYRHHLYMRATSNEARNSRNEARRSEAGTTHGMTSALLYPSIALPSIFENIFSPTYSSPWPFGYQAIFTTAFAQAPRQNASLCQASFDPNAIVGRIHSEVTPTAEQSQLLRKLGGALDAASGYLAKSCPAEIPAQAVARLQLMESQLEELAMALDIVRQPLQDFEQSLNADQQTRFAAVTSSQTSAQTSATAQNQSVNIARGCGDVPNAIDWSISEINQSVQPTATQRDALDDVKQSFQKAAVDLEAHCPTAIPGTALRRLDTIQARLDSTWRASLSIQVALANFETKLSDAQKVRFDAMNFAAR